MAKGDLRPKMRYKTAGHLLYLPDNLPSMKYFPFILLATAIACSPGGKTERDTPITYDEFHHYLSALSHDSTMGREPGTPGYDKSAAYCAQLMRSWSLSPAGDP